MKPAVAALLLLIALVPSGCTSTANRETLMRKATHYSLTPQPDITYYCGSKHAFDYFYIQPTGATTFRRARWLRVPESENVVGDRFEYTKERSRWKVLVGADRREPESRPNKAADSTTSAGTPAGRQKARQP
jgi:hypothetical protein